MVYCVVVVTVYCARDCAIAIFYAAQPSTSKKSPQNEAMQDMKAPKGEALTEYNFVILARLG